jgi:hypothetical protein
VHQLGRLADTMRQDGYGANLPPNLTDKQLSDPKRQRLTQEEAVKDLIVRTVRPNNTEDLEYALKMLRQAETEQSSWKSIDDDLDAVLRKQ